MFGTFLGRKPEAAASSSSTSSSTSTSTSSSSSSSSASAGAAAASPAKAASTSLKQTRRRLSVVSDNRLIEGISTIGAVDGEGAPHLGRAGEACVVKS
jgi:hypothetical protein